MTINIDSKIYYRTKDACAMAGISRATLFRWLKEGVIKDDFAKDRRGWRLFSEEDVIRLKKEAQRIIKLPLRESSSGGQT